MSETAAIPAPKIRHEWFQTDKDVTLSVFIKNVKPENLRVELQPRSVSLNIRHADDSEIVWDLDPLARSVDVEQSTWRVLTTKIELKLIKTVANVRWNDLEGDEESSSSTSHATTTPNRTGPSYPTSARVKRDWDAIAAGIQKEEDSPAKDDNKDPNAGGDRELNKLFQKLYAGATDEQRMAMRKSYQESNGTSLSTSWDEVKKGPVKTQPPDVRLSRSFL
ncbi:Cochaperone protein [Cystobasidiomycetes sp. EMM_F5]